MSEEMINAPLKAFLTMPTQPIILALDVADKATALHWVNRLKSRVSVVKVGMRLFYAEGPDLIREIQDQGLGVFLDLKLYDIPNTVKEACESLSKLKPDFLTVHASGGFDMLRLAGEVFVGTNTQVTAVTCLTSFTPEALSRVYPNQNITPSAWALSLTALAQEAGLNTIVCSPHEIEPIRTEFADSLTLITPGIRLSKLDNDDQARVMTPQEALKAGANYLVMGRPILTSENPERLLDNLFLN